MSRGQRVLIAIWLLVIVAASADMIYETRRADAANGWPSVAGRVVESRVASSAARRGGGNYEPNITYEYQVQGRTFRGRRIWLGSGIYYQNRDDAEEFLRPYPVGAAVRIFYNPADPSDAALLIENLGPMMIILVMAAMIGIVVTWNWPRLVAASLRRAAQVGGSGRDPSA